MSTYTDSMAAWTRWCSNNGYTKSVVGDFSKTNKNGEQVKLEHVFGATRELIIRMPDNRRIKVKF